MKIEIAGRDFTIHSIHSGEELFQIFCKEQPKFFTYDTETTGLHVKADKPFKGAVCFKNQVFVFDTTYDILRWFPRWGQNRTAIGHNMCFDVNMTANIIGNDFLKDRSIKYMDTMNLVQLAVESKSERRGGIKLGLKHLAKTYIDPNADKWEKALKKYLSDMKRDQNKLLTAYIRDAGYTRKEFDALQKQGEIPQELQEVYDTWKEENPEPTYDDVPEEILDPYLAVDVILTLLLAEKCLPIVKERKQTEALKIDSGVIPIVVRMARIGMEVDQDYLTRSKAKLESEIEKLYTELYTYTQDQFSSGQHAVIKKYFSFKYGLELESSDSDHLAELKLREADIIIKLRTLEKWLSTYVIKIQNDSAYDGRFYSLLNPFKAVSGRFSGDCQQFPKFPLRDDNGDEIFFPRRAFKGHWVFADFSQQELRVATHYAIQLGTEDMNLFRAYMPYKCKNMYTGEVFNKQKHNWAERQKEFLWEKLDEQMKAYGDTDARNDSAAVKYGWSAWKTETGEIWRMTDLHSATRDQTLALLGIEPSTLTKEEFKQWRQLSKITNFAKLYGAQERAIEVQVGVDKDTARALSEGYYQAFPSLKTYAEVIEKAMRKRGFVQNLYGRRYYMNNPSDFYRAGNFIIQGSCAYDVKAKMIQIQDYLDFVDAKTEMVITIHDEIMYTKIDGEEHIIEECVRIMENSDNLLVPLVSEVETTETVWADKK